MTVALINDKWLRAVIIGALVVFVLSVSTYVGLRLRATYYTESEVLWLRSEYETLHRDHRMMLERTERRLLELEQSVYGQLEPAHRTEPPVPSRVPILRETWSINRDRLLLERIQRLERWRLQQESK